MVDKDNTPRISRPKSKEAIISRLLRSTGDGPFEFLRDVIIFAAAVGWYQQRRISFKDRGEGIRWDAFSTRYGFLALVDMLALIESDDITILSESRIVERIEIFEEYANGGLEVLEYVLQKNSNKRSADVVRDLVLEAGAEYYREHDPLPDLKEADISYLKNGYDE